MDLGGEIGISRLFPPDSTISIKADTSYAPNFCVEVNMAAASDLSYERVKCIATGLESNDIYIVSKTMSNLQTFLRLEINNVPLKALLALAGVK